METLGRRGIIYLLSLNTRKSAEHMIELAASDMAPNLVNNVRLRA